MGLAWNCRELVQIRGKRLRSKTGNAGSTRNGHRFDLSGPATLVMSGTADAAGEAHVTAPAVPSQASGRTIYLEVASRSGGAWIDSNPVKVSVL